MTILLIVESPNKVKKISGFLGKGYKVDASVGIFRDMDPSKMSIDFNNKYEPIYVITKPDVVKNLKKSMKGVDMLYLATDLDREGEGIAQSIIDVLKPKNYKRIRFNAITKQAILDAIKNAGDIDENLVDAQKARRVLDRYAGYSISPLLQRQIGGKLSAGRVQSVAVRIVIDRENEIRDFIKKNEDSSFFKISGIFSELKSQLFETSIENIKSKIYNGDAVKIKTEKEALRILKRCKKSTFRVHGVNEKIRTQGPSPPFTTSTLQQEANKRFGFSVDATMKTAQKLYEGGYITYMRTDSVEISPEGHDEIKKVIVDNYGNEYYNKTIYKNKVANSQEAHEAIRPTHPELIKIEKEIDDEFQIKLYKLIWQRAVASQMQAAKINVTIIQIEVSEYYERELDPYYYFESKAEKIIFKGYLKVYKDIDEEQIVENIPSKGNILKMQQIVAKQEYMKPPGRYTQATLVKKLDDMGIGRPSTFANTIKTILEREYIKNGDVAGIKKEVVTYTIEPNDDDIIKDESFIYVGADKNKIIPTDLGTTVTKYLMENFPEMMDYKFTANMEEQLDKVANGKKKWYKVIDDFYQKLQPIVDELSKKKKDESSAELIGEDEDGNEIFKDVTKYGPVVKKKIGSKFVYAKIKDPLTLDNITVKDAIKLFEYPKVIGNYKKKEILLQKGQFGFYLMYNKDKVGIPEDINGEKITEEEAIKLIEQKQSNRLDEMTITEGGKKIKVIVMDGKFGPYIQATKGTKKMNYKIPSDMDPKSLTEEQIIEIMKKKFSRSKVAKTGGGSKKTKKRK